MPDPTPGPRPPVIGDGEYHTSAFHHIAAKHKQARNRPGKLVRIYAGYYVAFISGILWELEQLNGEFADPGWWMGREVAWNGNYTDPVPTLRKLKRQLGVA